MDAQYAILQAQNVSPREVAHIATARFLPIKTSR
jgi:hypothetical protein